MWKPQRHDAAASSPFSVWPQKQPAYSRMCQEYSYSCCWPADFLFQFKIMSTALDPYNNIVFFFLPLVFESRTTITEVLIHELRDSSVVMLALTENELTIRIDAGENGRRRMSHQLYRAWGECWCAVELSPDYWPELSTTLSLAPS